MFLESGFSNMLTHINLPIVFGLNKPNTHSRAGDPGRAHT